MADCRFVRAPLWQLSERLHLPRAERSLRCLARVVLYVLRQPHRLVRQPTHLEFSRSSWPLPALRQTNWLPVSRGRGGYGTTVRVHRRFVWLHFGVFEVVPVRGEPDRSLLDGRRAAVVA